MNSYTYEVSMFNNFIIFYDSKGAGQPGRADYTSIHIYIYIYRSEGFPGTGYFIPGHVGGWGWTGLGRPSAAALERSGNPGSKQLNET